MSDVSYCFDHDPSTVEHLLPIAAVGDGDKWCLDLDTRDGFDENPVIRWSHENGEVEGVADSFEEFVEMFEAGELED